MNLNDANEPHDLTTLAEALEWCGRRLARDLAENGSEVGVWATPTLERVQPAG